MPILTWRYIAWHNSTRARHSLQVNTYVITKLSTFT